MAKYAFKSQTSEEHILVPYVSRVHAEQFDHMMVIKSKMKALLF
jgi:hypothetical protein